MSISLQDITNIAAIVGVCGAFVGLILLIRQIKDSTAGRYIEILIHSTNEYATEEMLKAVRLVRETPIKRYEEIIAQGLFTSSEWVARRKVSAYWQTMAIMVNKRYIDVDTFFRLTQSTVTIYKKLREIRDIPNPHYSVNDLDDIEWLYNEWKKWSIKRGKKRTNGQSKKSAQAQVRVAPNKNPPEQPIAADETRQ